MRISKIHLSNFKRFTDLTITDIPKSDKLVLLIGSNGSGKSSIFDAFGFVLNSISSDIDNSYDFFQYYRKIKDKNIEIAIDFHDNQSFKSNENETSSIHIPQLSFYGRTSFRNTPKLTRTSLGQNDLDIVFDSDRSKFFIDKDDRFENDIEKITGEIIRKIFRESGSNQEVRERFIVPINNALKNIFEENNNNSIQLVEIIPPLEGNIANITFKKGNSEIHYNLLSAGEKEIFNVLFNLLSRGSYFQNTIYFLDEIDLHLNTQLQYNLIKEITENWIPGNCQLWTASHSLGFIEYAKQNEFASIIDFDDLDFDLPKTLTPIKDFSEVYEIAVGSEFLPKLFKGKRLVFAENTDAEIYNSLGIENTIFLSANNRDDAYYKSKSTNEVFGLIDRDFLSDDDIVQIKKQYPNLYILELYSIENYLYHPDNLEVFYQAKNQTFDKKAYLNNLIAIKNRAFQNISIKLKLDRTSYPFFNEPQFVEKSLRNRFKNKQENDDQIILILGYLKSDEFCDFYKSLPMKLYSKELMECNNLNKFKLCQTTWFKSKISDLIS